jgi:hypothetical protein
MASREELFIQYLVETQGAKPEDVAEYISERRARGEKVAGLDDRDWEEVSAGQQKTASIGRAGFDAAGRVLDYVDGLARTPYMDFETSARGYPDAVTSEDYLKALKGKAPGSAEYLERMGREPGAGTIAEGIARDLVLSPTNWASGGVLVAPKLIAKGGKAAKVGAALQSADKIVNPISNLTQKGGKAFYTSAFDRVDTKLDQKGLEPLSELAWRHGKIRGNATEVSDQLDTLAQSLGKQREAKYKMADELGGAIDPAAASKRAYAELEELRRTNPYMTQAEYDNLKSFIDRGIRPDPEALAQAQVKYQNEVQEYIPALRQYLRDKRQYRTALGAAGADDAQPVLSGMVDDLQRTGTRSTPVELIGAEPKTAYVAVPEYTQQSRLPDLPNFEEVVGPVKGGGRAESAARARTGGTKGIQKDFLDMNTKESISLFGNQGEFGGLSLTPRSYTSVQTPVVDGISGQTKMMLPPVKPVRPKMTEVPNQKESFELASGIKTNLREKLPASAYLPDGRLSNDGKKIVKALADGRQHEIVRVGNEIKPGLGDEIASLNQDYGVIKASAKPMEGEAMREANRNMVTSLDAMGAGIAAASRSPVAVAAGAAKKARDLGKMMSVQTKGGKLLYDFGRPKILDPLARRGLILAAPEDDALGGYIDQNVSPWFDLVYPGQ